MVTITSITLNKDVKDDISTYEGEGAGKGRGGNPGRGGDCLRGEGGSNEEDIMPLIWHF